VRKLKTRVALLNNRTERMEMMLSAIVEHMNLKDNINQDELDDED
jgi:hypothetical protein